MKHSGGDMKEAETRTEDDGESTKPPSSAVVSIYCVFGYHLQRLVSVLRSHSVVTKIWRLR